MSERSDPARAVTNQRFRVFLDDVEVSVAAVRGLVALRHTLAPDESPPTVTLQRSVTGDRTLFDWSERLHPTRNAEMTVLLIDADDDVVARWVLVGVRALRWQGPELDSSSSDLALEHLELAYDRLDWRDDTG